MIIRFVLSFCFFRSSVAAAVRHVQPQNVSQSKAFISLRRQTDGEIYFLFSAEGPKNIRRIRTFHYYQFIKSSGNVLVPFSIFRAIWIEKPSSRRPFSCTCTNTGLSHWNVQVLWRCNGHLNFALINMQSQTNKMSNEWWDMKCAPNSSISKCNSTASLPLTQ